MKNNTIQETLNSLGTIIEKIRKFFPVAENEFLEAGNKLALFAENARLIFDLSASISENMTTEMFSEDLNSLEHIWQNLRILIEDSTKHWEENNENLKNLAKYIQQLEVILTRFKKIVKQMSMLAIATRIESTRLRENHQNFNALADEVGELAEMIFIKSSTSLQRSQVLLSAGETTLLSMNQLRQDLETETSSIAIQVQSDIQSLQQHVNEHTVLSNRLVELPQQVHTDIGTIVISLQFHDIIRQKVEHTVEVFQEYRDELTLENPDLAGLNLMHVEDILVRAIKALKLQDLHLTQAQIEMIDAVSKVSSNLQNVVGKVELITAASKNLSGLSEHTESSLLDNLARNIADTAEQIKRRFEIFDHLNSSIFSTLSHVEEISTLVKEIESVGEKIEMIAINAQVHAIRTGSDGAALGVIARDIQRLAYLAQYQTSDLSKIIVKIRVAEKNLKDTYDISRSSENERMQNLTQDIKSLIDNMHQQHTQATQLLTKMATMNSDLAAKIKGYLPQINIHTSFTLLIDGVKEILRETVMKIEQMYPDLAHETSTSMENIAERYTMMSERVVHNQFIKGNESGTEQMEPSQIIIDTVVDDDSNIEFF
ncbi:MAG: hypothetical protein H6696_00765 [Deferribacteres bacterium]|nr:hypothetical protein [Deferribacteres bacterium]